MEATDMYQENNLDIGGNLIWATAPMHDIANQNTPPFVVMECGRFFARPQFYSKRAGGSGYLFLYTQSGKGRLLYREETFELTAGSIALIDCCRPHEYSTWNETNGSWTFYWLHFSSEHMPFFTQLLYKDAFAVLNVGETPLQIFDNAAKALPYSDCESLLSLHNAVYTLITQMIEASHIKPKGRKEDTNKDIVKKAADSIKVNHWQPFVLEDIAKRFGLSKYYFLRLFKEYTGTTPYQYMIAERISEAKRLLKTTDLKVFEISLMVGFADEGNFIRTFKAVTGATPNLFRLNE